MIAILLFLPCFCVVAQNLLVNPGAESGQPATNGWKVVNAGSNCYTSGGWRIAGNQNGFPAAHSGSYYFFPGCGGKEKGETYEIYQDVNVSSNAIAIDAHGYGLTFSGYTQSYSQSPSDGATIIVEARNGANTTVLGSYSTGETHNTSGWVYYSATAILPAGTRYVRVRLIGTSYNGTSIDSYFDDLSLVSLSAVPVGLLQFDAFKNQGKVFLSWQTTNDWNNKGFTIMRSPDQSNWNDLGFVPGNSQNTINSNYSFEDQNPLDGRNYYKLKQTDVDGTIKYSDIRTIEMGDPSPLLIYPNPARDQLYIRMPVRPVSVEIMDTFGKSIMHYGSIQAIDVSKLSKGVYILKIATSRNVFSARFIKG